MKHLLREWKNWEKIIIFINHVWWRICILHQTWNPIKKQLKNKGKTFEQMLHQTFHGWQISTGKHVQLIVSRNMQIKTTMRNLTCWNGNNIKSDYISNVDGDAEDPELSYTAGGDVESYKHPGREFCSFLTFYQ